MKVKTFEANRQIRFLIFYLEIPQLKILKSSLKKFKDD